MFRRIFFPAWVAIALLVPVVARATETENHVLRLLPAPGAVVVDGKADDWDRSGGVFVCGDVERLRGTRPVGTSLPLCQPAQRVAKWVGFGNSLPGCSFRHRSPTHFATLPLCHGFRGPHRTGSIIDHAPGQA